MFIHRHRTRALAPCLDTTIEVGTGGSFGDCTGSTPSSTMADYSAAHTDWSTGLAAFTAAAS